MSWHLLSLRGFFFSQSDVIRVHISAEKIDKLVDFLQLSLAANDHQAVRVGDSLYGTGSFYEAKGNFSLLYTCNSWAAEALYNLGCDINPHVRRASSVMKNLRRLSN